MAVKYRVLEVSNPQDRTAPKRFYARTVKSADISLDELSKEISGRSSLTAGDVKNVIEQLIDLIPHHLSQGNYIRLGALGSFCLSCSSEGRDTAEEVNSTAVKFVKPSFRPGKGMKDALKDLKYEKEK